jgi:hypothetical protein
MKKTFLKTGLVLVVALLAISCSKDGETGPAGPAGANGIDGNANVFGSTAFTTASTNWASQSSGTFWTANLTGVTSITQNVVDRGIVSVFRKYTANGATEWSPLPDTNGNVNISFNYGLGYITLFTQSTNFAVVPNPGVITFRYVVITPSNKLANPNTDWNDYNQVKEALNLKD